MQIVMDALVPEDVRPPTALDQFLAQMGVKRITGWRLRKRGALRTVNLYGRLYVTAREAIEFNRRLAAGEFAKDIRPPKKAKPEAAKPSRDTAGSRRCQRQA